LSSPPEGGGKRGSLLSLEGRKRNHIREEELAFSTGKKRKKGEGGSGTFLVRGRGMIQKGEENSILLSRGGKRGRRQALLLCFCTGRGEKGKRKVDSKRRNRIISRKRGKENAASTICGALRHEPEPERKEGQGKRSFPI